MKKNVLYIFEGIKPEKIVYDTFKTYFLPDTEDTSITLFFEKYLYKIAKQVIKDPDLKLFELLKEHNPDSELDAISSENISEIYLFFDYDWHKNYKSDANFSRFFDIFNDETKNGKLCTAFKKRIK